MIQELFTRDHGTVKVAGKSWMDGGYHVVLTPNGTYQHASGLPIKDEDELRAAFGTNLEELAKALKWFRNRHEAGGPPVRAISFHPNGYPVFEDGSIPDFADLYSFFKPGPILTAAIVALQQYKETGGELTLQALAQPVPQETQAAQEAAPQQAAPPELPPKKKKPSGKSKPRKARTTFKNTTGKELLPAREAELT